MGQLLGYWLKAPMSIMTNSLFRQRACIENLMRAALSLPPSNHLFLLKGPLEAEEFEREKITNGVEKIIPDVTGKLGGPEMFPEKVHQVRNQKELYAK